MDPSTLTAYGTFMTAMGTLVLAVATLTVTFRQIHREREEKRPNLVISSIKVDRWLASDPEDVNQVELPMKALVVEVANLSQFPIHVREVVVDTDDVGIPEILTIGVLVPPNKAAKMQFNFNAHK
jgi:hypothetical protein